MPESTPLTELVSLTIDEKESIRRAWSEWAPVGEFPRPHAVDRLYAAVERIVAERLAPIVALLDAEHWVRGTMPNGTVEVPLPYVAVADLRDALYPPALDGPEDGAP